MTDLTLLGIAEAGRLMARGEITSTQLTEAFLKRIEAVDHKIASYITVSADVARAAARQADTEMKGGVRRGPMHGIPIALKDIYETAGIKTTGHSHFKKDYVPAIDAETVRRLKDAGAVILGKLGTHEFANGAMTPDQPFPAVRNPWNTKYQPGGSSSGSGAAIAAQLCMGAMGSDTGGSIRNPAALCGLVGLKPTYGLVSRAGVYTNSFSYDHAGPMTWTVEDCAIMLGAIAGHDPLDPASANRAVPDYRAALTGSIKGLRIGVLRHLYEEDVPTQPAVKAAMEAAFDVLRGLGAVLEDVRIRNAHDYHDVKITGAESELYAVHEPVLRKRLADFGEDFLGRALGALLISSSDYVQASRQRRLMIAEMQPVYEKYDVLLTAAPGPAGRLDAWRTINFWEKTSLTTPFNVLGGPALAQCIGFTDDGLPMSMQVAGRPFDDATVLRVAHAYEMATPWRSRRPVLDQDAVFSAEQPPVPDPAQATIGQARRDEIAAICKRAGLTLTDRVFEQLCATAPHVEAMTARLWRDAEFYDEPSNIFIA